MSSGASRSSPQWCKRAWLNTRHGTFQTSLSSMLTPMFVLPPRKSPMRIQLPCWKHAPWSVGLMCSSFTTLICRLAMCWGNTLRKLRLCDIVADANRGPGNPKEGNLPLMLTFVLKRITGAKDAAAHVRIIGMWPHRDILRCGPGAVAAALFSWFYFDNETSFYFDNHDGMPPPWYNLMLVSWRIYKPKGEAYQRLYKIANVRLAGGKVTHLCKASINDAGQGGVSQEHISWMSKHAANKIDMSYLSERAPLRFSMLQLVSWLVMVKSSTMFPGNLLPLKHWSLEDLTFLPMI